MRRAASWSWDLAARGWRRLPPVARRRILHATQPRFLVGVVGLVRDDRHRVLLLEHRFRVPHAWGLPGGFMHAPESFQTALQRELREELDLDAAIDPHPFDTELQADLGCISITLLAHALSEPVWDKNPEIVSGGFFLPEELPEGVYPHHRDLVVRAKVGPRPVAPVSGQDVPSDA